MLGLIPLGLMPKGACDPISTGLKTPAIVTTGYHYLSALPGPIPKGMIFREAQRGWLKCTGIRAGSMALSDYGRLPGCRVFYPVRPRVVCPAFHWERNRCNW